VFKTEPLMFKIRTKTLWSCWFENNNLRNVC